MLVTRMPRDSRIAAREAAAIPFPRMETTTPVTNTYFVMYAEQGVKAGVYRNRARPPNPDRSRAMPVRPAKAPTGRGTAPGLRDWRAPRDFSPAGRAPR